MIANVAQLNELWDLTPPITPSPSRLFHLEPIGLGTCYVESLTSYVARLAQAHSVPPGTLLAIEVKPLVKQGYATNPLNSSSIVSLYGQASVKALNGTQSGAARLVNALETLTKRNDLQFLTMLPWAKVFPVLGLLRQFQAWCPYCYFEWLEEKQVIYSPLLWALAVVKICPYHHQPLESHCPHCLSQFLPLWRNSRPGFCLKCGGWLGTSAENYNQQKSLFEKTVNLEQEIWSVQTLGELIAQAPNNSYSPSRETIQTMLGAYIHQYTQGNVSAFARRLGLSRYLLLHWYSGATIPTLAQLMQICYTLSTTLVDFFQLQVALPSHQDSCSEVTKTKKRQSPVAKVTSLSIHNQEHLAQAMQLALEEEPPPSLTQLALRLGYNSYSSLTTCSKTLSAAIIARFADYQHQLRQEKIRQILENTLFDNTFK